MKIYFAGSIRGGRGDKEWYARIIAQVQQYGEVLTEHVGDRTLSELGDDGPTDEFIYARNMAWLKDADIVIAEVSTPSLGVGYEIAWAELKRKPVLCLDRAGAEKKLSAMISGNRTLYHHTYRTWDEVAAGVDEFMEKMR